MSSLKFTVSTTSASPSHLPIDIAQIAARHIFPMRAVDRNNPEEPAVHVVIEEDDLAARLHDLRRRSDARHAWRLAAQDRVLFHLARLEVLHLGLEFRLVFREVARRWRTARASGAAASRRSAGRRAARHADRAASELLRPDESDDDLVVARVPRAVQIGMAVDARRGFRAGGGTALRVKCQRAGERASSAPRR